MTTIERAPRTSARVPHSGAGDVLQLVRDNEAETRRDVQELTGLSRITVAQRIDTLLEASLLRDAGERATGGRRAGKLQFNVDHAVILVAALDTRHATVALTRLDGEIIATNEVVAVVDDGPERCLGVLIAAFQDLLGQSEIELGRVGGVAISIPGPVDPHTGRPSQPPIMPGWDAFPIADRIRETIDVPVFVENDADAMAFGEQSRNFASSPVLCLVKVSTGIGTGIVIDGKPYHGIDGGAGDIGHIRLAGETAVCQCGSIGCLAAVASGRAVAQRLTDLGVEAHSGRDVRALLSAGNVNAMQLTHEAGARIGEVLATVVSTLNPGILLVGGDLASTSLIGGIRETLYPRSLARATRNLDVRLSTMGEQADISGLTRVAVDSIYAPAAINALLAR